MTTCTQCGTTAQPGDRFCTSCGRALDAPPPPAAPAPSPTASIGGTSFAWPTPDKTVAVAGRTLPLDIVVVAGVYAVAALWLFLATLDMWRILPDVLASLFSSDAFTYAFGYILLFVIVIAAYVIFGFGAVAYLLLRSDPLGRGLSAVIAGVLFALAVSSGAGSQGTFLLIVIVAALATAVLYLSPWARRAFAASPRRAGQPPSVVLARVLHLSWYSLIAVMAVLMLLGIRFIGTLGVHWLFTVAFTAAGAVLGYQGYRLLAAGPNPRARLLLLGAAVAVFIGAAFDGNAWMMLIIGIALNVPLWLAPGSRAWFGDTPVNLLGSGGAEG